MRRRVSRAREWSDSEIGLAVNRKTETLHTNFVRKLNNEVAAYDVGEGGRSNKGDEIRVLEWRGCWIFGVLSWISYLITFSLFMRLGLWTHASY